MCKGQLDLCNNKNLSELLHCKHLAEVIKAEQLRNQGSLQVSKELENLVKFILDAINCDVGKKPAFARVPDDQQPIRKLETFPARPIIRRQVLYSQDIKNKTQILRLLNLNPLEFSKESEKMEFLESHIICKNKHESKKSVTPGMFVFSCIHRIILGNFFKNSVYSSIHG